jgi:hypothetical protein
MPVVSFCTARFTVMVTHQEHLNLTLGVELEMTISLEPTLYKFSELLRESRIIQVVHSETGPGGFGRQERGGLGQR